MDAASFEKRLGEICAILTEESKLDGFKGAKDFENRVRALAKYKFPEFPINDHPAEQVFPDISIGLFGIEVKFTLSDTWRSVANSVLETNRDQNVLFVYVIFAKMGGSQEVRWARYEDSVMHVRTSHVPRFEVEIGTSAPLFSAMGVSYDEFRQKPMHEKMMYIREYARSRLRPGERLWWLEDAEDQDAHTLPIQARLYTKLPQHEKIKLRAEAVLLCPIITSSGRVRNKYDDVVLYLLTYHGVLCHQARDLFSAGSVANPLNDDEGGLYIQRSLSLLEPDLLLAASSMDSRLFVEYWGYDVEPPRRIIEWLYKADSFAKNWQPSKDLFSGRFCQKVEERRNRH